MLETQTVTILVYAVLHLWFVSKKSQKLLLLNETCKADELFFPSLQLPDFSFFLFLVFPTKSDLDSFVFEASKLESLSPSPAALWHDQDLSTNEHQHLSAAMFVFQYAKEGKKKIFFGRWTDSLGCASTAAWRDIKRYKRWECVIKSAFSLIKLWR